MADLQEIQSDLLGESPKSEPVEIKGHELLMFEMDVNQYQRFSQIGEALDTLRAMYRIIFECLKTKDGQQVFDETHLDNMMESSSDHEAPATRIRDEFLIVNDLASVREAVEEAEEEAKEEAEGN